MLERPCRCRPAARRALDETLLDQEGLNHILERVPGLGQGGRQRFHAHRATAKGLDQGLQIAPVETVQTDLVDLQPRQRPIGHSRTDLARAFGLGEIADTAQQAAGDAGCAAGAAGNLLGAILAGRDPELGGVAPDDRTQLGRGVEFEPHRNTETVPQRRRQQTGPRGRTDQGKGRQINAYGPCGWALADHEVETEILHRRIEHFLDRRRETVDLVNKEHITRLKIGEDGREVTGFGNDRSGGGSKADAELAGDDLRQGRLAQARRTGQQDMIERFLAPAGGVDKDLEIGNGGFLADEIVKGQRTHGLVPVIPGLGILVDQAIGCVAHGASSFRARRITSPRAASSPWSRKTWATAWRAVLSW